MELLLRLVGYFNTFFLINKVLDLKFIDKKKIEYPFYCTWLPYS